MSTLELIWYGMIFIPIWIFRALKAALTGKPNQGGPFF